MSERLRVSGGCSLAGPVAGCSHTAAFSFTLAPDRKPPPQRWTGRGNAETEQNKAALAERLHHHDDEDEGGGGGGEGGVRAALIDPSRSC